MGGDGEDASTSCAELCVADGWDGYRMLCEDSDGAIMRGSIDIASILEPDGLCWREGRERCPLEDVRVRDWDAVTAFATLFTRRIMRNVAMMRITRIATAPPMIPPSWAFVRPPLLVEELVGLVLGIAVWVGVTLAMTPLGAVLLATSVGTVGVEAVVIVDVTV